MTRKRTVEDYVKTIYALQKHGDVHGVHIARELKLSKPTVSVALKAMEQEGFLCACENHAIVLTAKGLKIAEEVTERNNMFYNLLVKLGVDSNTAIEDACNMEHAISAKSFQALTSIADIFLQDG